jgi:hypothetical protein
MDLPDSPPMKHVADTIAPRVGDSDHSRSAVSRLGTLDESRCTASYSTGHNDGFSKPVSPPHLESADSPRLVHARTQSEAWSAATEQSLLLSPTRLRRCSRSRGTPELKNKRVSVCVCICVCVCVRVCVFVFICVCVFVAFGWKF